MKRLLLLLAAVTCAAQDGPTVTVSPGPPVISWSSYFGYDGSNNLIYRCWAHSIQRPYDYVQAAQFTSIVVSSNTATVTTSAAHGLSVNNPVTVGGSATAALNGTYKIVSVPSSTTLTFTTSGVSNGTYTDLKALVTTAPRLNANAWAIEVYTYTAGLFTNRQWVNGGGSGQVCANQANLTAQ